MASPSCAKMTRNPQPSCFRFRATVPRPARYRSQRKRRLPTASETRSKVFIRPVPLPPRFRLPSRAGETARSPGGLRRRGIVGGRQRQIERDESASPLESESLASPNDCSAEEGRQPEGEAQEISPGDQPQKPL